MSQKLTYVYKKQHLVTNIDCFIQINVNDFKVFWTFSGRNNNKIFQNRGSLT